MITYYAVTTIAGKILSVGPSEDDAVNNLVWSQYRDIHGECINSIDAKVFERLAQEVRANYRIVKLGGNP